MKRRKLYALMLAVLMVLSLVGNALPARAAATVGLEVDSRTPEEIRAFIKAHPAPELANTFTTAPSTKAPYAPGELSETSKTLAFNSLNQMRYIAGLPADVTENAEFTKMTQAASLVNAVNRSLSHTPAKPADMEDALYQLGYSGASSSNIAMTSWEGSIVYSVFMWMEDSDSYNIDRLGHRRWILNPPMLYTGFGAVGGYSAVYAFDRSRSGAGSYKRVAWPAQNMPVEYFGNDYAWSVSFGTSQPKSDIQVKLVRRADNATWNFSAASSDGYFNVENSGYGQPGCVIFRPDNITYSAGDVFDVTIIGSSEGTLQYSVNFFTLCDSHEYESVRETEPTCTTRGRIANICKNCAKITYEYENALGHSYKKVSEASGLITMRCSVCGDEKTGNVPSGFTAFWKKGSEAGSYSSQMPTGLGVNDQLGYYIPESYISYNTSASTHFNEFVIESDDPENCVVSMESSYYITGAISFKQPGTYKLTIYPKYAPTVKQTVTVTIAGPLQSVSLKADEDAELGKVARLTATAYGGIGTLSYSFVEIGADGTETVLNSNKTQSYFDWTPNRAGSRKLRVDVTDAGDSGKKMSSEVLTIEVSKIAVSVAGGKKITVSDPLSYGQKLKEAKVENASFEELSSGAKVTGTFAFDKGDEVLSVGTHEVTWSFTPADANYETLTGSVKVTVVPAKPVISQAPTASKTVYAPGLTLADVTLSGGKTSTEGTWSWKEETTGLSVPGGTYLCVFTPKDTTNYTTTETKVSVAVEKATPYLKLTGAKLTYGQSLKEATLTAAAQYSAGDATPIGGSFNFEDEDFAPEVKDSESTVTVNFVPNDTANYQTVRGDAVLTVEKADRPKTVPPEAVSVSNGVSAVTDAILTGKGYPDWSFLTEAGTALAVGEPVTVTATYVGADAANYENITIKLTITRSRCDHDGDVYYKGKKTATCTETGYTGDMYCSLCDELLASGTTIPTVSHSWDEGRVSVEATVDHDGTMLYRCKVCGTEKTEAIPALPPVVDIRGAEITGIEDKVYNGDEQTQSLTVIYGDAILAEGKDYILSYENNKKAGVATVYVTGIGAYEETATFTFTIEKRKLTLGEMKFDDKYYDGSKYMVLTSRTPTVEGVVSGDKVEVTTKLPSYVITGTKNAGSKIRRMTVGLFTISGADAANYKLAAGTVATGTIKKVSVDKVTLKKDHASFNGRAQKPSISRITGNNGSRILLKNCRITYTRNGEETKDFTSRGTITVTVTGQTNWKGSRSVEYTIR